MKEKFSSEEQIKKDLEIQKSLTNLYKVLTEGYQKLFEEALKHAKSEKTWIVPFKFAQYLEKDGSIKMLNSPREAHKFTLRNRSNRPTIFGI